MANCACRQRWTVAFASFWANFCLHGVLRSSSVIFVALIEHFGITREEAAWPSAVFGCFMSITGVITAYLSHHFSNRSIMMTGAAFASLSVSLCCFAPSIKYIDFLYGACTGAGMGAVVPLTHVTINQCFTKHRALAMGIAHAGSSAGSFLFPTMAQKMLEEYGLSSTFLLLGGIMLHSLLGLAFLNAPKMAIRTSRLKAVELKLMDFEEGKKNKISVETNGEATETKLDPIKVDHTSRTFIDKVNGSNCVKKLKTSMALTRMVLTNATFILVSATFSVYFSISAIYLMVILDFVQGLDMSKSFGVSLVSAFSFGDLAGRLVCGWIGDMRCISRSTFVRCNLVIMSILLVAFPWHPTYASLSTASIFLGIVNGCIIVNYSPLLAECLGMQKLALTVGFSSCIVGLTAFLRPTVIGYFRDQKKDYNFLFVTLGVSQTVLTALWFLESERTKSRFKFCEEKISVTQ